MIQPVDRRLLLTELLTKFKSCGAEGVRREFDRIFGYDDPAPLTDDEITILEALRRAAKGAIDDDAETLRRLNEG